MESRYATKELEISGVKDGQGLGGAQAIRVLAKCRGVKWLRLMDFKRLSCRLVELDALAGLKTLHLLTPFPDPPSRITSLHPSFTLTSLHLFNRTFSPSLLVLLLRSSSSSLRSLHISMSPQTTAYPGLIEGFEVVAPGLSELRLLNRPSEELVELLHLCTRLRVLVCHASVNLQAILDALPWPTNPDAQGLETLDLAVDYNALSLLRLLSLRLFSPTTRARLPAGPLANLQTLILRGTTSSELQAMGQSPFLRSCERGGIRVELDEDGEEMVAGRRRGRGLFD